MRHRVFLPWFAVVAVGPTVVISCVGDDPDGVSLTDPDAAQQETSSPEASSNDVQQKDAVDENTLPLKKCDPAGPFNTPTKFVTSGMKIDTVHDEMWPRISRDDKTLHYARRDKAPATADGGSDAGPSEQPMRVRQLSRLDVSVPFDMSSAMTEAIAGHKTVEAPMMSLDGLRLYISRETLGGQSYQAIFFSERAVKNTYFPDLITPISITVNGTNDEHPYLLGNDVLYLASSNGGGTPGRDIYRSVRADGGSFGPRVPVVLKNGPNKAVAPVVSSDESVVFFSSLSGELYRAIRPPGGTDYTAQVAMDLTFATAQTYAGSLSADDCTLYFHSNRTGSEGFDIWVATATVVKP